MARGIEYAPYAFGPSRDPAAAGGGRGFVNPPSIRAPQPEPDSDALAAAGGMDPLGNMQSLGGQEAKAPVVLPNFSLGHPTLRSAPAAPAPVAPALSGAGAGGGRGFVNPSAADPSQPMPSLAPSRPYTRVGNSFSDGSTSQTPNVSTIGAGDPAILDRARAIEAQNNVLRGQIESNGQAYGGGLSWGGGSTGIRGDNVVRAQNEGQFQRDKAAYQADEAMRLGGRRGTANASLILGTQQAREQNQSYQDVAKIKEQGDTIRAGMQNKQQLAIAQMHDETQRRGQDVSLRGQDMTARTAANAAKLEQMNKDRAYQMDVQKYGTEVAEKNRTAREQDAQALQKNLESRFRTTDDKGNSVADQNKIASYQRAMTSSVPAMIQMLRQTGTPEAKARADELEQRGTAALTPQDHDRLQQLFETRELARQTHGIGFGKSTFVDSDNLFDYAQKGGAAGVDQRLIGGNRIVTNNGTNIAADKLRYGPDGNVLLPNIGTPQDTRTLRGYRTE